MLEAAHPGEALLQSERHAGPIHLLLTDVVMPKTTGPRVSAERIKLSRPDIDDPLHVRAIANACW